tara:strand:+ start:16306 stop:17214 length:909 start_codon:yes stop_codon:yes gene_type:complete
MKYWLLFFLLASPFSYGQSENSSLTIHIILSNSNTIFQQAAASIQKELILLGDHSEQNIVVVDKIANMSIKPNDLIITVGNEAAEKFNALGLQNPIIYAFIEKSLALNLNRSRPAEHQWVATVTNQPIQRMISISEQLINNNYKNKIVIVLSEKNRSTLKEIQSLRPLNKGVLDIIKVPQDKLAAKIIADNLFNAAALVAVHDDDIWSSKSATLLLHQAFNYKVPVVGYSKKFLTAGALISVSSATEAIANETAKLIHHWLTDGAFDETGIVYSDATLNINKNIARALQLPISRLNSLRIEE